MQTSSWIPSDCIRDSQADSLVRARCVLGQSWNRFSSRKQLE